MKAPLLTLSARWKAVGAFVLLALAPWHIAHSQAPWIAEAPEPIQKLAADLKGKPAKEVRQEIIKQFGPAQRDIGSGFQIEQWDLYDGVLTFTSADGKHCANFAIFSSKRARTLTFWSPEPLGFSMSSSWKNYWQ
jgi:hypothetical protein